MSLLRLTTGKLIVSPILYSSRSLATIVEKPPPTSSTSAPEPTPTGSADPSTRLRPYHNIEVDPDHGLWAFFRKNTDGKVITMEPAHKSKDFSGRAWEAAELRRKSFKDLHTLWYVSLRERNLLATQRAEFRRQNISMEGLTNVMNKDKRVRKTMKHIKLVLNERRLAYVQAKELWYEGNQQASPAESVAMETPSSAASNSYTPSTA